MAHHVTLLVARDAELGEAFRLPPFLGTIDLGYGLVATPLMHDVIDGLGKEATAVGRIEAAGQRLSKTGALVFIQTDYFGGTGGKEVAAWLDGKRIFCGREGAMEPFWLPEASVQKNVFDQAAMLSFGLSPEGDRDAFDRLGLGKWRHTEDMIDQATATRGVTAPLGVILAGGLATRMGGGDKGLLDLGGRTILGHVIDRLSPQVAGLALNANGDPTRFETLGLPVLADSIEGFAGPLAGVLAGLDWAAEQGATHIVTAAADTPFFPADLVPQLQLAAETQDKPIALARTANGRHPTFGLWPVALRDDLREALEGGVRKVVQWTDRHGTAMADFPDQPFDPFFNVNTPEDLAEAQRLMARA